MKLLIGFNLFCLIWVGICFYMNWDGWLQFSILIPNMIGWTTLTWLSDRP